MRDINILSLDLELNQPSGTIIQVGACIGNLVSEKILEEYNANICCEEIINPVITQLTGITQAQVDDGISLKQSYEYLKKLHQYYNCFRNPLVWGGGDSECLKKQLFLNDKTFFMGRRWIDAKTLFVSLRFTQNEPHQAGLSKAMTKLGLQFQGRKHNACDDARNTFYIYLKLLKQFNIY